MIYYLDANMATAPLPKTRNWRIDIVLFNHPPKKNSARGFKLLISIGPFFTKGTRGHISCQGKKTGTNFLPRVRRNAKTGLRTRVPYKNGRRIFQNYVSLMWVFRFGVFTCKIFGEKIYSTDPVFIEVRSGPINHPLKTMVRGTLSPYIFLEKGTLKKTHYLR